MPTYVKDCESLGLRDVCPECNRLLGDVCYKFIGPIVPEVEPAAIAEVEPETTDTETK